MAEKVLVVEDERDLLDWIRLHLERDGYEVMTAQDGTAALELARRGADAMVLDIGIPAPNGLEVTRRVRGFSTLPILIVTARADETDRVTGLELGADDYLTKPFSPRELVARVRALIRRSRMPHTTPQAQSGVYIDADTRRAFLDGEALELTRLEYDLLKVLLGAPGRNFTREELLDRVWGEDYVGDVRRVDAHISNLRDKLTREGRQCPIRSVWGVGYRFDP